MWRPLFPPPVGDATDELGGGEWLLGSISENQSQTLVMFEICFLRNILFLADECGQRKFKTSYHLIDVLLRV